MCVFGSVHHAATGELRYVQASLGCFFIRIASIAAGAIADRIERAMLCYAALHCCCSAPVIANSFTGAQYVG